MAAGDDERSEGNDDGVELDPESRAELDIDVEAITTEELAAQRRTAAIEAGRRKAGTPGAAMAGAMIALSEIYEGPKRDEIVAISESPDEPTDIDTDGIRVDVGEVSVESRPPEREQP